MATQLRLLANFFERFEIVLVRPKGKKLNNFDLDGFENNIKKKNDICGLKNGKFKIIDDKMDIGFKIIKNLKIKDLKEKR